MKNRKIKRMMALFLMCLMVILNFHATPAFAQQQQQQEQSGQGEFVLTYPDGSTETLTDYEEAKAKLDEWKLLYEGKTNPDGLIELEGWAQEGEIKIVEKKVPTGYWTETTEWFVDLKEGEIEIVNNKPQIDKSTLTAIVDGKETVASDDKEAEVECEAPIDVEIKDEIKLSYLEPEREYTVVAFIYNVDTEEQVADQLAEEKVVADEKGEATVTINFTTHIEEAGTYTVKTVLTSEGIEGEIATHNDAFDDKAETVIVTDKTKPEVEKISISVKKIWDDWDNLAGHRPEEVVFNVLQNGDKYAELKVSAEGAKDKNTWVGNMEDLPKTDTEGKAYEYTIEEIAIEWYASTMEGDASAGFTVTNINRPWTPKIPNTSTELKYGTFTLQKTVSGEAEEDKEYEIQIDFTLPDGTTTVVSRKFSPKQDPVEMDYVLEGTKVKISEVTTGYEVTYTVDGKETQEFTIANGDAKKVVVNNDKPAQPKKETPNTGDDTNMGIWMMLMGACILGVVAIAGKKSMLE